MEISSTGVCTTEYHSTTEYQFFYFSYRILRKRPIYVLYFCEYILVSVSVNIQKQIMDIFIKILENNLDEREIKFHVFDTILRLTPVNSESLKISLQTNIQ